MQLAAGRSEAKLQFCHSVYVWQPHIYTHVIVFLRNYHTGSRQTEQEILKSPGYKRDACSHQKQNKHRRSHHLRRLHHVGRLQSPELWIQDPAPMRVGATAPGQCQLCRDFSLSLNIIYIYIYAKLHIYIHIYIYIHADRSIDG